MNKLLQQFEAEQTTRKLPAFGPGDTVVVNVKVKEGNRERVQAYEGVVIAIKNAGLNSAFTVRKISHGIGVERVFQTHSAVIESVHRQAPRRRCARASCTTCATCRARRPASRKTWPPARLVDPEPSGNSGNGRESGRFRLVHRRRGIVVAC